MLLLSADPDFTLERCALNANRRRPADCGTAHEGIKRRDVSCRPRLVPEWRWCRALAALPRQATSACRMREVAGEGGVGGDEVGRGCALEDEIRKPPSWAGAGPRSTRSSRRAP